MATLILKILIITLLGYKAKDKFYFFTFTDFVSIQYNFFFNIYTSILVNIVTLLL